MDNKYLEELDCHGGEYGCGYRRVVKLKKLVIHGCKNLRNLSAGNNGKIELGFSAGDFKKLNKGIKLTRNLQNWIYQKTSLEE